MLPTIRIINCIFNRNNSLLIKNENKVCQCVKNNFLWHRMISGINYLDDFETEAKALRPKTRREAKIRLIHPDNSMTVTLLENAEKIAKRRNLQLINVTERCDSDNDKSVYKLVTTTKLDRIINGKEKNVEESKQKQKFKSTKLFNIKAAISEHDLIIKIANMNKLLKRNHRVKILLIHLNGDQENVIKMIKNKLEGKIFKEDAKKGVTVLTFLPSLDVPSYSLESNSDTTLS